MVIIIELIIARLMHEGYCSRFDSVCVCCQSSASVLCVCNKLNLPFAECSQLTDFTKKPF